VLSSQEVQAPLSPQAGKALRPQWESDDAELKPSDYLVSSGIHFGRRVALDSSVRHSC
jgi:hypothetical protein